jgi:chitin synthase
MITQLVNDIVLVAFLKKFMFKDRMTTFEYEFLNALWRVTRVVLD